MDRLEYEKGIVTYDDYQKIRYLAEIVVACFVPIENPNGAQKCFNRLFSEDFKKRITDVLEKKAKIKQKSNLKAKLNAKKFEEKMGKKSGRKPRAKSAPSS